MKTRYIQVPVDEVFRPDDGTEIVCREDPPFNWLSMCEDCPLLSKNFQMKYVKGCIHFECSGDRREDGKSTHFEIVKP